MGPLRFGRYPLIHLIHPILCSLARWPVWLRAKLWWPANKGPYVDSCSRMKLAAGWKLCLAWQKPTGIAVCRQRRGLAPFGRLAPRPAPAMEWKQRNSSLFFFFLSLSRCVYYLVFLVHGAVRHTQCWAARCCGVVSTVSIADGCTGPQAASSQRRRLAAAGLKPHGLPRPQSTTSPGPADEKGHVQDGSETDLSESCRRGTRRDRGSSNLCLVGFPSGSCHVPVV